ncbi:glycosyltransferase family 2 protein [Mycetocola sp. 2940]|uniref:glycosyltransferase family 2 protein n=1 Tax=Mycetocola sp. 2940 TaxID=3156452 RepID=UPI003397A2D3
MRNFAPVSTQIREVVDRHAIPSTWLAAAAALRPSHLRPMERVPARDVPRQVRRARVSVVVPCYNYAHFLRGAVGSALAQEDVDVQVVIVDDRSPDDTASVAAELAQDPRVTVVSNEQNLGHVRSFNRGLEQADGEFLVRLDADDLLTPGCLSRAVALFRHDPGIGLVYGNPYHFTTATPPAPRSSRVSWTIWSGADWLEERCRRGVNCITTPEAMVRMSVMHQVGPLDTRLRFAQDMELWCRIAAGSAVGRVNGVDQALHRDHDSSMSATDGSPALVDLEERRQVFASVFESTGAALPNAAELHSLATRVLARESVTYADRALDAGDRALAEQFLGFARETAPAVLHERGMSSVQRRTRNEASRSRLRVLRRRLAGVGREFDYVRWAVHGV